MIVANGTLLLVGIVECDCDSSLGDPSLSIFVHQLLQIGCSHLENKQELIFLLIRINYVK